jgi:hypothetical protein
MGERPDTIASHIAEERKELGEDIRELEIRTRKAFDWREQVRRSPIAALVAGALGGLLLAALLRR